MTIAAFARWATRLILATFTAIVIAGLIVIWLGTSLPVCVLAADVAFAVIVGWTVDPEDMLAAADRATGLILRAVDRIDARFGRFFGDA